MSQIKGRIGCVFLSMGLWACHGDAVPGAQAASAQETPKPANAKPETPEKRLVNTYIALQTKLATDDLAGAKSAFMSLQSALKAKGLQLDPAVAKRLGAAASQGAAASKLSDARVAFAAVTDGMLAYLGSAKNPLSTSLTVAHCPMALDSKGAKWLQLGDKLENPYFGSEMLRCGSVEKTVPPGKGL